MYSFIKTFALQFHSGFLLSAYPGKCGHSDVRGNVLIEPAIEHHVTYGGAHGRQMEAEKGEVVEPWLINHERIFEDIFDKFL